MVNGELLEFWEKYPHRLNVFTEHSSHSRDLLPFVRTKGNQKPPAGKKWLNRAAFR
jgi:hypothetical protein